MQKVDFNLVYWEGMEKVIKSFQEMFLVWVTKQVAHFNRTNRQLTQIDHTKKHRMYVQAMDVGTSQHAVVIPGSHECVRVCMFLPSGYILSYCKAQVTNP